MTLTLQESHLRMLQTRQSCMIRGETTMMILHLLRILHLLLFLHRPYTVISHLGNHPLTNQQQVLQTLHAHHLLLHLLHAHQLLLCCLHHLHVRHLLNLRVPPPMTMQTIMLASDPILCLAIMTTLRQAAANKMVLMCTRVNMVDACYHCLKRVIQAVLMINTQTGLHLPAC